jgi:HEPN domain-containing protein
VEAPSGVVKKWFSNASEDLRGATVLHQLAPTEYMKLVPYLCQQAAEKSIKAYLTYRKIKFEKTHDIGRLAALILPFHPELDLQLKEASRLSIFALQFRYPDSGGEPTIKDSEFSIRVAKGVFDKMTALVSRDLPMKFD